MQNIIQRLYKKWMVVIAGFSWAAGLLIAGSDSEFMPFINILGLILFFCASMILGKYLQTIEADKHPTQTKRPGRITCSFNRLNIQQTILDT